jgi:hypothetical protein
MEIIQAINLLLTLTNSLSTLAGQASIISDMIQKVQAEGRTTLTPEEWKVITQLDDSAREELKRAIG